MRTRSLVAVLQHPLVGFSRRSVKNIKELLQGSSGWRERAAGATRDIPQTTSPRHLDPLVVALMTKDK